MPIESCQDSGYRRKCWERGETCDRGLKFNGYPVHVIRSAEMHGKREQEQENQTIYRIFLSYMYGSEESEDLRRILEKFDVRTLFTTIGALRQKLARVKDVDPPLSKAGVVNRVPCSYGKEYIGEIKRALGTCIKEHQSATNIGETEGSAIVKHAWVEQLHSIWD